MGFLKAARRVRHILTRVLLYLLGGIVVLLLLLYIAFLFPFVQRYAAQQFCRLSAETVGIHITLESLRLDFPASVDIRRFVCYDENEDTLIYAGHVTSSLSFVRRGGMYLGLGFTTVDSGMFQLIGDSTGQNISKLVRRFKRNPNKPPRKGRGFEMDIEQVVFANSRYRMRRQGPKVGYPHRVDYRDMDVHNARGTVKNLYILRDTVAMEVEDLAFDEKSGFHANRLDVRFSLCSNNMIFENIYLETDTDTVDASLYRMDYHGWKSMADYYSQVKMTGELKRSRVRCHSLGYFFRFPYMPDMWVWAQGKFEGTVDDFRVRNARVEIGGSSVVEVEGKLEGLPNIYETLVNAEVHHLATNIEDIGMVASAWRGENLTVSSAFRGVRHLSYKGAIVGFLNDFVAYGTVQSNMGVVRTDLGISYTKESTHFHGGISAQGLALQKLRQDSTLGRATFSAQVDGKVLAPGNFETQLDATVDSVEILGRTYTGISAQGFLAPKRYAGALNIQNALLDLHFDGLVDLAGTEPHFRFRASSSHADLQGMGIVKRDSVAELAMSVEAELRGKDLDSYQGRVEVFGAQYRNTRGEAALDRLSLEARNVLGGKMLSVDSDPLHATVWGAKLYAQLWPGMKGLLAYHLPLFFERDTVEVVDSIPVMRDSMELPYRAEIRFGKVNPLLAVVLPRLRIAEGTYLNSGFDADNGFFDLRLLTDSMRWDKYSVGASRMRIDSKDSVFSFDVSANDFLYDGLLLDKLRFRSQFGVNEVRSDVNVVAHTLDSARLALHAITNFDPRDSGGWFATVRLLPSDFLILDKHWQFSRARIILDTSQMVVHNLALQTDGPLLRIHGVASRSEQDTLHVLLDNMDLALFNRLLAPLELSGQMQGDVGISSVLRNPSFTFSESNHDLKVNGAYVGSSTLEGFWRGKEYPFQIGVKNLTLGGREDLSVDLTWDVEKKKFGGRVRMDSLSLALLTPLTGGALSGKGGISADLALSGTLTKPRAKGYLAFNRAKLRVAMLNKWFSTSSRLHFKGDRLRVKQFVIREPQGGVLTLRGTMLYDDLKDIRFDLKGHAEKMQLLNTPTGSNPLYYGDVVSTADIGLQGIMNNLQLTVKAKTDPGTNLTIEMPSQRNAESQSALEFVQAKRAGGDGQDSAAMQYSQLARLFTLNGNFDVTRDALTKVVVDPSTGAMLKLRGDGRLHLVLEPQNRIPQIYGDYTIARGEYTFVFQGIVSKKFRIQPGGVLRFTGNPEKAYADISAVYRTRASLDKLLVGANQEKFKRRIPVDCTIHIAGTLQNPKISFSVDVPQADPETKGLLAASLNTEEKVMRQFASLVVLNMFAGSVQTQGQVAGGDSSQEQQNANSDNAATPLLSTFWEMLFNQVNSWISQIEKAPSIALGFNYRPGSGVDRNAEDEAEVSVSMQWFDGRLNVDANWDVNKNNTSSAVAGDINVTQQSLRFPHLQYKAFARSNDDLVFSDLNPYTAGAGVVYSNSFNSFSEVWQRFLSFFGLGKKKRRGELEEKEEDSMLLDSVGEGAQAEDL